MKRSPLQLLKTLRIPKVIHGETVPLLMVKRSPFYPIFDGETVPLLIDK